MNFDQLGKQHVSRRRKPSPIRKTRHSQASFDSSFSQHVWPRARYAKDTSNNEEQPRKYSGRGRRKSGFSIPMSWLKNIAIAAGVLVVAIVGPNWDTISGWFKMPEVTINSLRDPGPPFEYLQASIITPVFWSFTPPITEENPNPSPEIISLDLMEPFSYSIYIVVEGDTISAIALKFSRSMESIIALNGLKETWNLQIGLELKIPNMDGVPYTVLRNDTVEGIAKKMKTPKNAILDANNIVSDIIHPGEILFIPGGRMDANEFRQAIRRDAGRQNAPLRPMIYPVSGRITSGYGWRLDPVNPRAGITRLHHAIDLSGRVGDPVKAAMTGTVINRDNNPILGNFIILGHGEYQTLYAHLSVFSVNIGDVVEQGQEIGKVGNTGYTTGSHLHFEVFRNAKRINPLDVLR